MLTFPCYLMTSICDDSSSRSKVKLFDSTCNIVTYYIQIYIPTFTPGLQSARETLMVESAQSRRVADIVCLTPGRPHSVTEKSHSNPKDVFTTLFTCITLYPYTTGTVKREWPLLELNIFKFHPTFSSYVYAIR